MSGQSDKDTKTEEPTEKRRSDTLERDGGPFSREVSSAAILAVVSLFLATAASSLIGRSAQRLAGFIEAPGAWRLESGEDAIGLLQTAVAAVSGLFLFFAVVVSIAAVSSSILQNVPRLLLSRITPDFSRVSPGAGFDRLFNSQSLIELLKGIAKIAAAGLAAIAALGGITSGFYALHSAPDAIPALAGQLSLRVIFLCAAMATVIAAADIFFTRRAWRQRIMMSKQEIKEELKQAEGDATLKGRLRAIARARIKRRMMLNVPKATLVIANPTHYAIALRYVRGEDAAPKVLAKGQGAIALKIREIASRHNVPIIENKPLAKSLFDATTVDQLIPAEFYKAIAELIIYLNSKSRPGQHKPQKTAPKSFPKTPLSR